MRIAIFSDNFYPELSGITDSVVLLGKTLASRGHKIMFFAPRYTASNYKTVNFSATEFEHNQNIEIVRLPSLPFPGSPTGQSRIAFPSGKALRRLKKFKPDIIHTNSPFGVGVIALVDAKLLGIPIVGTNHTPFLEFMAYSPLKHPAFTRLVLRFFSWYYNRCQYVTAPCNSLIEEMRLYKFNNSARVLSNPVDLSRFIPVSDDKEKADLKRRLGFSSNTVLYTGRLAPEKHVDVIIKAVDRLRAAIPNINLVITGHGSFERRLREMTETLGLGKIVKFLGFVDDETFPLVYKASDLFAIMSTAESQSLSLIHAMSCGLPVMGARARALPEYINEKNGIVVPVGDDEKLAEAMLKIFNDRNIARELGGGGIQSARLFSSEIVAQEWEKIYEKVINDFEKNKVSLLGTKAAASKADSL